MQTVGSYEAKTHLPQLLDAAATGQSVEITRHGRPVARLIPAQARNVEPGELIDELRRARAQVSLEGDSIREMIDEGRH